MKKNSVLFLLLFALGISSISCTKDFEDGLEYSGIKDKDIKEGDQDDQESDDIGEKGDYWPTAVGNQWIWDENGSEVSMKMIAKEGDYYRFDQFAGIGDGVVAAGSIYLKKVKGDYILRLSETKLDYGEGISGKMTGYEYVLFKDYLDINKTWKGTFVQTTTINMSGVPPITMNFTYTGTILEKIASITINDVTYNDVIKFSLYQESKILDQTTSSNETQYWIAKNIGIIKYARLGTETSLITYDLKK